MRKIALSALLFLFTSCEILSPRNWDKQTKYIMFFTYAEKADVYTEIRYYLKEMQGTSLVTVDSVTFNAKNKDGTDETFEANDGFGIGFDADSVALIENGSFEAVAVKKDNSLVRKGFGKITNGITHNYYRVYLGSGPIVVELIE